MQGYLACKDMMHARYQVSKGTLHARVFSVQGCNERSNITPLCKDTMYADLHVQGYHLQGDDMTLGWRGTILQKLIVCK